MASSQVEIASSSSTFGCALRDHNRGDRCSRESNARATFQKNLKELVQNHLHSCISGSPTNSNSESNDNPKTADFWARREQNNDHLNLHCSNASNNNNNSNNNHRKMKVFDRSLSLVQSNGPIEIPHLGGVSTLVQRWRGFEAEAKSLNSNNSPFCNSRSYSGSTFTENNASSSFVEVPQRNSNACEFVDGRYETPTLNEDSFADWESDRAATSGPPSSRSRDSDATESERLRVADIIRRLSSSVEDNKDHKPQGVLNESSAEHRCFSSGFNSPRIRGRQAFSDLLLQREHERHRELEGLVERKPVSRFTHRGRIHALLRVRFLRSGAGGAEVKGGQNSNSIAHESDKPTQGSSVMHLREKFNTGVEHGATDSRNPHGDGSISARREVTDTRQDMGNSSTSIRSRDKIHHPEVKTTFQERILPVQNLDDPPEETSAGSDLRWQGTSHEINTLCSQECTETTTSLNDLEESWYAEKQESDNHQPITSHDWVSHSYHPPSDWEEQEVNSQHLIGNAHDWMGNISHPQSALEDREYGYQQPVQNSHDWISDISRPRSNWEGLRQARYQEMLDPYLDNEDIRQLLESGLKGRIDQLMLSRTQREPHPTGNHVEEDIEIEEEGQDVEDDIEIEEEGQEGEDEAEEETEEEQAAEETEDEEQGEEFNDKDEEQGEDYNDDDDNDSHVGQLYNRVEDDVNHTTSSCRLPVSSSLGSWSPNRGYEDSDDYDKSPSPTLQHSISSDSYTQDNGQCSSFMNHSLIEKDIIYDLRGHMEQLQQEMAELRRSIKSCMNMQAKLQRSTKKKVAAAVSHSGELENVSHSL
ncbi:unnamed protein product [Ilex paraguariensis]|uniref:Uncharacterized protein n=1 Tax=Ilex paraguariensis TaxID=185542 RepID=A0ABC8QRF1_9AQUA